MMKEKDVWDLIHYMESVCQRDDLKNMSKEDLCSLVEDVFDRLSAMVM